MLQDTEGRTVLLVMLMLDEDTPSHLHAALHV